MLQYRIGRRDIWNAWNERCLRIGWMKRCGGCNCHGDAVAGVADADADAAKELPSLATAAMLETQ